MGLCVALSISHISTELPEKMIYEILSDLCFFIRLGFIGLIPHFEPGY